MTLSKIARLANVSVSTASKAFSMSPEVNEETREMIFDIAKKNGAFKKFFNAKYPKLVIAVICPELESLYYASTVAGLGTAFEKRGCEMCIATTQFSIERGKELVDYYSKYTQVDGIVLLDAPSAAKYAGEIPVVCTGGRESTAAVVSTENVTGLKDAILHFKSHGITDIGFIGEKLTSSKLKLFKSIMTDTLGSFNEDHIAIGDRFSDGAYKTTEALLERGKPPRALICAYDYLAIGAMRALRDKGYRVPEDVAIIGMDNIPEAEYLTPSLSSIDNNNTKRCEAIAETLINIMMGNPYQKSQIIKSSLKLRESSRID